MKLAWCLLFGALLQVSLCEDTSSEESVGDVRPQVELPKREFLQNLFNQANSKAQNIVNTLRGERQGPNGEFFAQFMPYLSAYRQNLVPNTRFPAWRQPVPISALAPSTSLREDSSEESSEKFSAQVMPYPGQYSQNLVPNTRLPARRQKRSNDIPAVAPSNSLREDSTPQSNGEFFAQVLPFRQQLVPNTRFPAWGQVTSLPISALAPSNFLSRDFSPQPNREFFTQVMPYPGQYLQNLVPNTRFPAWRQPAPISSLAPSTSLREDSSEESSEDSSEEFVAQVMPYPGQYSQNLVPTTSRQKRSFPMPALAPSNFKSMFNQLDFNWRPRSKRSLPTPSFMDYISNFKNVEGARQFFSQF